MHSVYKKYFQVTQTKVFDMFSNYAVMIFHVPLSVCCLVHHWRMSFLFVFSSVITDDSDGICVKINKDEKEGEDLVECIFAYYKGSRFSPQEYDSNIIP